MPAHTARRLLAVHIVAIGIACSQGRVAADAMPGPGRPDWSDTPQPEPTPIPLEAAVLFASVAAGLWWTTRQRPSPA